MRYRFLRFPGGKPKAVTFSYDDGCIHDLRLSDIFEKYGMKGTFNLNGEKFVGSSGEKPTKEQVKEYILDRGHEIAIHGYYHRANGRLRNIEGIKDVLDCRVELENKYDIIVRGMAYPDSGVRDLHNGGNYDDIKQYLTQLDVAYVRTAAYYRPHNDPTRFHLPTDWHKWEPGIYHGDPNADHYIDTFLNFYKDAGNCYSIRPPQVCYIHGHSYEFDRANNWELMEHICERLSNQEDVWYATNIEIYDYVKAYDSLIFSADGHTVYNPSAKTIWFVVDNTPYCVKPDETIKIEHQVL